MLPCVRMNGFRLSTDFDGTVRYALCACLLWVNLDEIPTSLGGLLGNVETLKHMGSTNVMALSDENHFKRMGTLIAMLGVKKEGDAFSTLGLKPAVMLQGKKGKVVANPRNILFTTNVIGVINGVYM